MICLKGCLPGFPWARLGKVFKTVKKFPCLAAEVTPSWLSSSGHRLLCEGCVCRCASGALQDLEVGMSLEALAGSQKR